jgi:hypothetical protein
MFYAEFDRMHLTCGHIGAIYPIMTLRRLGFDKALLLAFKSRSGVVDRIAVFGISK